MSVGSMRRTANDFLNLRVATMYRRYWALEGNSSDRTLSTKAVDDDRGRADIGDAEDTLAADADVQHEGHPGYASKSDTVPEIGFPLWPVTQHTFQYTSPAHKYIKYSDELIGTGSFKRVYKAYDLYTGREVAWNEVSFDNLEPTTAAKVFQELKTLQMVNHPNIIKMYDQWFQGSKVLIFTTELMPSGTLRKYVRRINGPIRTRIVKQWCLQILEGLAHLHSLVPRVIHRDLKAQNLFVDGSTGTIKIGDLGLCASLNFRDIAVSCIGTPEFMAPETYSANYDHKIDIYAFGMCILEMVTREFPYNECNHTIDIYRRVTQGILPESLKKVSDPNILNLIQRCIAVNPADRPNAADLLTDPYLCDLSDDGSTVTPTAPVGKVGPSSIQAVQRGSVALASEGPTPPTFDSLHSMLNTIVDMHIPHASSNQVAKTEFDRDLNTMVMLPVAIPTSGHQGSVIAGANHRLATGWQSMGQNAASFEAELALTSSTRRSTTGDIHGSDVSQPLSASKKPDNPPLSQLGLAGSVALPRNPALDGAAQVSIATRDQQAAGLRAHSILSTQSYPERSTSTSELTDAPQPTPSTMSRMHVDEVPQEPAPGALLIPTAPVTRTSGLKIDIPPAGMPMGPLSPVLAPAGSVAPAAPLTATQAGAPPKVSTAPAQSVSIKVKNVIEEGSIRIMELLIVINRTKKIKYTATTQDDPGDLAKEIVEIYPDQQGCLDALIAKLREFLEGVCANGVEHYIEKAEAKAKEKSKTPVQLVLDSATTLPAIATLSSSRDGRLASTSLPVLEDGHILPVDTSSEASLPIARVADAAVHVPVNSEQLEKCFAGDLNDPLRQLTR